MSADWNKIKTEYITTNTSYRKLAEKYGIHYKTIAEKGKAEGWKELHSQHSHKTVTKILECDTQKKVDRASKLMSVADKLLMKVERFVDESEFVSPTSAKNLSDALKNIKEVCMVRTQEDIEEQKARIAKLQKEADREDNNREPIRVILDDGLSEYGK